MKVNMKFPNIFILMEVDIIKFLEGQLLFNHLAIKLNMKGTVLKSFVYDMMYLMYPDIVNNFEAELALQDQLTGEDSRHKIKHVAQLKKLYRVIKKEQSNASNS